MAFAPPQPGRARHQLPFNNGYPPSVSAPSFSAAASSSAHRHPPRFIHDGKIMEFEGTVFDKLLDPALYTGTHKHRFDAYGRGRGLQGRREDYALLDGGVMFEQHELDHGDEASAVWVKSLRAAMHSPSVAKRLGVDQAQQQMVESSSAQRRRNVGVHAAAAAADAPPVMLQAWRLDDDGRLQFDEQRTGDLVREHAHDRAIAAATVAVPPPHHHLQQRHRSDSQYSMPSSSTSMLRSHQQQPQRATTERPHDVRKKNTVTSEMRRLLYDDAHGLEADPFAREQHHSHPLRSSMAMQAFRHEDGLDAEMLPSEGPRGRNVEEPRQARQSEYDNEDDDGVSLFEVLSKMDDMDSHRTPSYQF